MIDTTSCTKIVNVAAPAAYTLICGSAVGFDLFTDRSFGAFMLAVVPISFVALACLLIGPWVKGRKRSIAARDWLIGALLVLFISMAFVSLGADQARTGELIFTYAVLIMSLPASLILPFVEMSIVPLFSGNVFMRIIGGWVICVVLGWLEWHGLGWLYKLVRRRLKKTNRECDSNVV